MHSVYVVDDERDIIGMVSFTSFLRALTGSCEEKEDKEEEDTLLIDNHPEQGIKNETGTLLFHLFYFVIMIISVPFSTEYAR